MQQPDETAEQIIRRWLADVEAGRILHIGIAGVSSRGTTTFTVSKDAGGSLMVAAPTLLQHRAVDLAMEASTPWDVGQEPEVAPEPTGPESDDAFRARLMAAIGTETIHTDRLRTDTGAGLDELASFYEMSREGPTE